MTNRPRRRRDRRLLSGKRALVFSALIFAFYFIAPLGKSDQPLPLGVAAVLAVLLVVGMALVAGRGVRRMLNDPSRIDLVSLGVAIETVMIIFAITYYMIERSSAGEFVELKTRLDSMYFTLTTVTTTGFGDVHAAGQVARGVVTLQLIFNAVVIGALARTVSFEMTRRAQERNESRSGEHGEERE